MSKPNQDTAIMQILKSCNYGYTTPTGKISLEDAEAKIEALITQARIDELENRLRVQFIPSHWQRLCAEVNSWAKYVDRRIAELKREQEK